MKKHITLFILFFFQIGLLFSQDFEWAKTISSSTHDDFQAIEIDDDGNVFTFGNFGQTTELDGVTLTAVGGSNMFLAKHTPEGELLWVKTIDGGIATARDMKIDIEGNIILVGHFEYGLGFGNTIINTGAGTDIFLAKLDASGDLIWLKYSTHTPDISAQGIRLETDHLGDIIIAAATFNPQSSPTAVVAFDGNGVTNNGHFDALILKYSKDGDFLWLDGVGGASPDLAYGLCVDENNNIYVTGIFYGEVIFGGTDTLFSDALAAEDLFLVKYRPNGEVVWAQQSSASIQTRGQNVIADQEGHIYLTGYFIISMEFGGQIVSPPDTALYAYISKLDTLGDLLYTNPYARSTNLITTRHLDLDENGNPFILGRYQGEGITHDGTMLSNSNNQDNIMLTKHDKATGDIIKLWYGGGENRDIPEDIAVKNSGEIYMAGRTGSLDITFLDTTLFITQSNPSFYDSGFFYKLFDDDFVNIHSPELLEHILVYPNPIGDFIKVDLGQNEISTSIQVFNSVGKMITEQHFYNEQSLQINSGQWSSGIYFLKIKMGDQYGTVKVIK